MVERLLSKESGTRSGGPKGASLPARPFPERKEALPLLVFDHILKYKLDPTLFQWHD